MSKAAFPLEEDTWIENAWRLLIQGFDGNIACLSFHMIIKLAEYIIRANVPILRALRGTYTHVFLDEFQDTTALQYALVVTCFYESKHDIDGGWRPKAADHGMGWCENGCV